RRHTRSKRDWSSDVCSSDLTSAVNKYQLEMFQVQYGTSNIPTATVSLTAPDGKTVQTAQTGQGSVEALYKTLDALIKEDLQLTEIGRASCRERIRQTVARWQ